MRFFQSVLTRFYRYPLFVSRCAQVGRNLSMSGKFPHITGHTRIYIGEDVRIQAGFTVSSGRTFDDPTLVLEDGVILGERVVFSVNRRVVVGAGTHIGSRCYISDNDGHPRDPEARVKGLPPAAEDILPVSIGRNVRIGSGTYVTKGVTIGDGAGIAMKSVVSYDILPGAFVAGNPARPVIGQGPG
ncbi:MAG: acyltransferase [Acidobacteriaceae bacterium]|nr:acyltransferase [Acidobacteriaceae bacterium]MBV9297032.1 acyltransferase [Acidobacteriaceae bacterium]MBV9763726.1 acyltransferase [Acidobacteriaceae bacterium]